MTDQDRYEERLEARIHAYVRVAGQDFDAVALTRAAAMAHRPGHRWLGWLPTSRAMRPVMLALIVLLLVTLAAIGIAAATRLLERSDPLDVQAPGTFALTGSMSVARYWHTAVRLADGRVLIIGGFPTVPPDDNDPPAPAPVLPAEIYDPATGSFTILPALSPANQGSSATLLQDGRVLIAGGRTRESSPHPVCYTTCRISGTALDSAVLFDPRTGTTSPAGSLNVPRFGQAAILLNDGRVLVVGGWTGSTPDLGASMPEPLASAELYDPASNSFLPAGSLAVGVGPDMESRVGIAAMLLPDGRVLVEDQIFDPTVGRFRLISRLDDIAGDPVVYYLGHQEAWYVSGGQPQDDPFWLGSRGTTATLLKDGRVLSTGGVSIPLAHTRIGNPSSWHSEPTGLMNTTRLGNTATLLGDGRVLVVGGWTTGPLSPDTSTYAWRASLASAELYVPPPLGQPQNQSPGIPQ